MATNVAAASVLFGSLKRELGAILGDTVNVKDYGAIGDGAHDDTTNIQAAVVAAFGPEPGWKPRGQCNRLYFPAGLYRTTAPIVMTSDTSIIYGDGKYSSIIKGVTAGTEVFRAHGWCYGAMHDLGFWAAGGTGSRCFVWRSLGTVTTLLTNLTMENLSFRNAEYLVELGGNAVDQGSETIWINCDFRDCNRGLVGNGAGNNLNNWVVGCRFDNCSLRAISRDGQTVFPLIQSCKFSRTGDADPTGDWTQIADIFWDSDSTNIINCHTTSFNFVNHAGRSCRIIACTHISDVATEPYQGEFGVMGSTSNSMFIEGCYSLRGTLRGGTGTPLYFRGNTFLGSGVFSSWVGPIQENI